MFKKVIVWFVLGLGIAAAVVSAGGRVFAEDIKRGNIIKNGGFEKWEWAPIESYLAKEIKALKSREIDVNAEIRAPTYRCWTKHGFPGYMIEGEQAYKGKSLYINNDSTSDDAHTFVIGLHTNYGHLIEPGKEYEYEIYLKGKGKFMFRAWVQGVNPATGKTKWLGFPNLIDVNLSEEWRLYKGTLRLPDYDDPGYIMEEDISCAIVINHSTAVYVDEFKMWEKEQKKYPEEDQR